MTNLQDLMDRAWAEACAEMDVADADHLMPADFQSLNDLQTEIFIRLGGDLDQYYLEAA